MIDKKQSNLFTASIPYLIGALAGCIGILVIQPIDTVKVIIQLKKQKAGHQRLHATPFSIAKQAIKKGGISSLYKGIDAALIRQFLFSGLRLGFYKQCDDYIKGKQNRNMTFTQKMVISLSSGMIASLIANPFQVALIRFQADNNLPDQKKRNYKNVFNALIRISKQQGLSGLWRGAVPTAYRSMAVSSSNLVAYNTSKQFIQQYYNQKQQTMTSRLISSAVSGLAVTVFSLPFDNIRTKMMQMLKQKQGNFPYKGFSDCLIKSIKHEGIFGLWIGISTYYMRIAPHAMIIMIFQDLLHDLFKNYEQS